MGHRLVLVVSIYGPTHHAAERIADFIEEIRENEDHQGGYIESIRYSESIENVDETFHVQRDIDISDDKIAFYSCGNLDVWIEEHEDGTYSFCLTDHCDDSAVVGGRAGFNTAADAYSAGMAEAQVRDPEIKIARNGE